MLLLEDIVQAIDAEHCITVRSSITITSSMIAFSSSVVLRAISSWSPVPMSTTTQTDNLNLVIGEFRTVFKNKGVDPPLMSAETILDGSLGLESLDFAEVVMRLEQVFGKDPFSGDTIPEVSTVADLCALY